MLNFSNIIPYMEARSRLRRSYWGVPEHNRESDRLVAFTTEQAARMESRNNLAFILDQARAVNARFAIVKPVIVQMVGMVEPINHRQAYGYGTFDQLEIYSKEHDKGNWWMPKENDMQVSDRDRHVTTLRSFGAGIWITPEDQGFYDVVTGAKITNRREQIQQLWDLGFASRRGRPVHVVQERWAGSRTELEILTEMADRVWDRYHVSEMARKMVAAYRGITKYVAWPGSW